jgi:hypothetical protein
MKQLYFMKRVHNLYLLFTIVFLFVTGCAAPVRMYSDYEIKIDAKPTQKIPIRIGLYLTPYFENYSRVCHPDTLYWGEGLSISAKRTLKTVFEDVVLINKMDADLSNQNIQAVITPEITDSQCRLVTSLYEWYCSITCKWTIVDLKGKPMYTNTFIGEYNLKKFGLSVQRAARKAECMTLAIEDHYNKFLSNLISTKWWEYLK